MKIVLTGVAGFIVGNFVCYIINKYKDYKKNCVDCLTYVGNVEMLDLRKDVS